MFYIINFFAGPGAGKSTAAAGLFNFLKIKKDIDPDLKFVETVELVHEYAKDLVYSQDKESLKNQIHIFGEQHHRIWKILNYWNKNIPFGKSGIIINDSPLLMQIVYHHLYHKDKKFAFLDELIASEFFEFSCPVPVKNINIFLNRSSNMKYEVFGRNENKEKAELIDDLIYDTLDQYQLTDKLIEVNAEDLSCVTREGVRGVRGFEELYLKIKKQL
jgi:hypothetical protein